MESNSWIYLRANQSTLKNLKLSETQINMVWFWPSHNMKNEIKLWLRRIFKKVIWLYWRNSWKSHETYSSIINCNFTYMKWFDICKYIIQYIVDSRYFLIISCLKQRFLFWHLITFQLKPMYSIFLFQALLW